MNELALKVLLKIKRLKKLISTLKLNYLIIVDISIISISLLN